MLALEELLETKEEKLELGLELELEEDSDKLADAVIVALLVNEVSALFVEDKLIGEASALLVERASEATELESSDEVSKRNRDS